MNQNLCALDRARLSLEGLSIGDAFGECFFFSPDLVFKLIRAGVVPVMLAAGRGSVVNVASEAGLRGNASGNAYTVSKHGVVGLTRSAAQVPRAFRSACHRRPRW